MTDGREAKTRNLEEELKKLKEHNREKMARITFQSILEDSFYRMNVCKCIADTKGFFVLVNPAFMREMACSFSELTGKPFIEFVLPEDREKTLAEFEKIKNGHEVEGFTNRYLGCDGEIKTLTWNAVLVQSKDSGFNEDYIHALARIHK